MMLSFFAAVIAIGMFLQPQKMDTAQATDKPYSYGVNGTMLKIMADIESRRIKVDENMVQIFQLDQQYVLVKRQANVKRDDDAPATAVYLIEVAGLDSESNKAQLYAQSTVLDFGPNSAHGELKVGNFRSF
jgi:hypothetical protein